ncbi:U4/U6.U5 tri-snRNP-associated protein 1 [Datura stramonium]|uniref:U4/U6.U5 tri-snRNP-associated protein 1 n=1 Tax=Datura stramonium TaxID=4076 RepID=A0ABS8V7Y0_DATST|nr:U4/U6.U5 tri-snRNP-associated protein 1 [Datura stramonium]
MDRDDAILFDDDDNEGENPTKNQKSFFEKAKRPCQNFSRSIASLINDSTFDNPIYVSGESQVVFTEIGDFVWRLQLDKSNKQKPSVDVLQNPSTKEEEPPSEEKYTLTGLMSTGKSNSKGVFSVVFASISWEGPGRKQEENACGNTSWS